MKILQYWEGSMPEIIKNLTDSVKAMAKANGITYELANSLPQGSTLPEGSLTDTGNKAGLFRFDALSKDPSIIWMDCDVEAYKLFVPMIKNKCYLEKSAGVGIIQMNNDWKMANEIKGFLNFWENGKINGIKICQVMSIAQYMRTQLMNYPYIIPDGYYKHYYLNTYGTERNAQLKTRIAPIEAKRKAIQAALKKGGEECLLNYGAL